MPLPRVLITGFGVFPGAPTNPTELLIPLIEADRDTLHLYAGVCELHTAVLPVEYQTIPLNLTKLSISAGSGSEPGSETESGCGTFDIAIHFGLSSSSETITLEYTARNETRPSPDASGYVPPSTLILPNGPNYASTLPLLDISSALDRAGIPYTSSHNAGGYLCNYIFYLGRAGICEGFRPEMSGFVHVPPVDKVSLEEMREVARIVVEQSCAAWRRKQEQGPAPEKGQGE